jgi:hypothetical protein
MLLQGRLPWLAYSHDTALCDVVLSDMFLVAYQCYCMIKRLKKRKCSWQKLAVILLGVEGRWWWLNPWSLHRSDSYVPPPSHLMALSHFVSKINNFCIEVLTDCCTNKIRTQQHTLGVFIDFLVLRYEYMIGYTLKENSEEGKIRLEPKMWCLWAEEQERKRK